jgi:ribonuclease P/MRP protein subunit RPP1
MRYFDLHVHSAFSEGLSSFEQLASAAKELGYSGICISSYFQGFDQMKKFFAELERARKVGVEIFSGFEARNTKELQKLVELRRKFDVLLVHGGDLTLNRIACETSEVDILTHPEAGRIDSGLNHVLVKDAAKNNVAIEINFREVLMAENRSRAKALQKIETNVRLAEKYHAPIIVSSGAVSHWELKDPQILISFAEQLGAKRPKELLSKIPEKILQEAKERKSEKWIISGVKVIK